MKRTKTQKGITLVALIITIVILLILAVVAITAITNDNVLSYANNAAIKYQQGKQNETNTLVGYEDWLNKSYGNGTAGGSGSGGSTGGSSTGVNLLTLSNVSERTENGMTYSINNGRLTLEGPVSGYYTGYHPESYSITIDIPCTYNLKSRNNI